MARDGWLFVAPALILTGLSGALALTVWPWAWVFSLAGALVAIGFAFFFRDPSRNPPDDPTVLVAPADGRILVVEPHPGGGVRIDIFLSVFDVHVNRSPATGRVLTSEHRPGAFVAAMKPEAGHSNERQDVRLSTSHGPVEFAQIAGILARRIVCRLTPGDEVRMGDRIGLIRFGSRMLVISPPGFSATVRVGDRVCAGESVIARLADGGD